MICFFFASELSLKAIAARDILFIIYFLMIDDDVSVDPITNHEGPSAVALMIERRARHNSQYLPHNKILTCPTTSLF